MISDWSDFCTLFSLGFGSGMLIGMSCLMVRRIRLTLESGIKRSVW